MPSAGNITGIVKKHTLGSRSVCVTLATEGGNGFGSHTGLMDVASATSTTTSVNTIYVTIATTNNFNSTMTQ